VLAVAIRCCCRASKAGNWEEILPGSSGRHERWREAGARGCGLLGRGVVGADPGGKSDVDGMTNRQGSDMPARHAGLE
jgi:hypothetical protein